MTKFDLASRALSIPSVQIGVHSRTTLRPVLPLVFLSPDTANCPHCNGSFYRVRVHGLGLVLKCVKCKASFLIKGDDH